MKKITLLLILFFLLSGCSFFPVANKNNDNKITNQRMVPCSKVGETIESGAHANPNSKCCEGLKAIDKGQSGYRGDCESYHPLSQDAVIDFDSIICTVCGDGVCNSATHENKCNCSEDCKY